MLFQNCISFSFSPI